ncbi:MAG: glycosyltransferase [Actinobacteria bacterium]|nr:MAG: glycosyltransferase [Actinomycetota bacterium]
MRFLFVHEVNWRSKVTYEIHDIPELLSLAGHTVFFIDYPEVSSDESSLRPRFFRTTVSTEHSRAHKGSSVEVLTPGRILPGLADRLIASLTFVPLLIKTIRNEKIDLIVLYGVPTNGWQTVVISKILRVPIIFRAIDASHLLRGSIFKFLIRMVERFIYTNVDHISVHNAALAEYCIKFGAKREKVSIEYPGLDMNRFSPGGRDNDLAAKYGIQPTQKIVFFRGTLYRFCGLEQFLELFSTTLHNDSNIVVLIVGSGESEQAVNAAIGRLGIQRQVILRPFVDYAELVKHIRLADVSINTFVPSLVTDCALPGRVLQSLSCGVAVVSTPLKGIMGYTGSSNAVVYATLGHEFVKAVNHLLANRDERDQLAVAGRQLIESKGDWIDFISEFVRLSQKLVARK